MNNKLIAEPKTIRQAISAAETALHRMRNSSQFNETNIRDTEANIRQMQAMLLRVRA